MKLSVRSGTALPCPASLDLEMKLIDIICDGKKNALSQHVFFSPV
jgi:hypothetical protein